MVNPMPTRTESSDLLASLTRIGALHAASRKPPIAQASAAGEAKSPLDTPAYLLKAREDAEAAISRLEAGAKENAQSFRNARLDMARAKLTVLRIEAIFSARLKDAKAAKKVAAEAAKVARELKGLREEGAGFANAAPSSAAAPSAIAPSAAAPSSVASPTPAPSATAPSASPAQPNKEGAAGEAAAQPSQSPALKEAAQSPSADAAAGDSKEIDGLIQFARKIIAIARKAVKPGSDEDRELARLQNATGKADLGADTVTESDMDLNAGDLPRVDMTA
jgi:hypothetical protein